MFTFFYIYIYLQGFYLRLNVFYQRGNKETPIVLGNTPNQPHALDPRMPLKQPQLTIHHQPTNNPQPYNGNLGLEYNLIVINNPNPLTNSSGETPALGSGWLLHQHHLFRHRDLPRTWLLPLE
jgi:hypothetical protein